VQRTLYQILLCIDAGTVCHCIYLSIPHIGKVENKQLVDCNQFMLYVLRCLLQDILTFHKFVTIDLSLM
jgi:hypothetical protein